MGWEGEGGVDGIGWDGKGWDGVGWEGGARVEGGVLCVGEGVEWREMRGEGREVFSWYGMVWDGMRWGGVERDGT